MAQMASKIDCEDRLLRICACCLLDVITPCHKRQEALATANARLATNDVLRRRYIVGKAGNGTVSLISSGENYARHPRKWRRANGNRLQTSHSIDTQTVRHEEALEKNKVKGLIGG